LTYQHHLELGLRGLYDIALTLNQHKGQLNWEKLIEIGSAWGSQRVTWLTLILVRDLLSAEIPNYVLTKLQPMGIEPWVIKSARSQLLERGFLKSALTPDLAQMVLERGIFKRLRLIMKRVFVPKLTLSRLYNVPPTSLRIYRCYFKRIGVLLRSYIPTIKRFFKLDQAILNGVQKEQTIKRLKLWMVE
jgi:hypothetical protein